MASRTEEIIGRVLKNLRRHGVSTSEALDEDVLDELNKGQDAIISEVQFRKEIVVTLNTNAEYYPLSSDAGAIRRLNITSVKVNKIPAGWMRRFSILTNKEFSEIADSHISTAQPIAGTIIDNRLKVYPIPGEDFNGNEIELFVNLSSSSVKITKETNPELPEAFDKALEFYTTSQFLTGQERQQWLNEYQTEVRRIRAIPHRDNFPKQAPSIL